MKNRQANLRRSAARRSSGAGAALRALLPALLVCLALAGTARAADNTVYANDYQSPFSIYTVDPATGALSAPVGALSFSSIAIARRASDGLVFYTEFGVTNGRVYTWNPTTNANTNVGRLGNNVRNFPRLAFNAAGVLYGMDDQGRLYTVNTTSGAATIVGTNANGGNVANFPDSIRGDMAFAPDGTLYATAADNSILYRIDIAAMSATQVGSTGQTLIAGNAFVDDGLLLSVQSDTTNVVATLSLANGSSSPITTLAQDLYDMAAMPKFANLSISKTTSSTFVVGSNASYTISVANGGPHSASGPFTVRDVLPAGLTYVSASGTGWTCSHASGTVTCTRTGNLASGSSWPAITLNVTVGAAAAPSVTNTATVAGTTFDHVLSNNSGSVTSAVQTPTDLTITKGHAGNFTQGGSGTYTVTVTNSGSIASSGTVTVTDTLPAGLTPGAATGTGWTCGTSGQTVTCTRSTALNGGASYPAISIPVTVALNAPASVTNTATVSGGGDSNTSNNSASDPTTIDGVPDLTVTKGHSGNFTQGQNGTYTITVGNAGGAPTSGTVTVSDTLPAGLSYVSATGTGWTCGASGQVVTCTRSGALAAGSNYPAITLTVSVASNSALSLTNTATVSGGGQTNTSNDSSSDPTTVNGVADVTIAKSHAGNFSQGQNGATYTLTVSNAGGAATSGTVTVTDTLPSGLSYVSAAGTGWACSQASGTVTCTRATALGAGASYPAITLTVNVAPNAPSSVTNTASVSGGGQTNTSNDSASDPTTINGVADVTIAKSHTGNFTRGTTGTYTLTVSNAGGAATSGTVTVTDTLPAGLSYSSATGTGWTCSHASGTVTCTRATALAAGASYPAITLVVNVSQTAAASLTNTASVSGGGQTNTSNDSSSDPTNVVSSSDLSLSKTVNNPNPIQGQNVTFTVTLSNAGPSGATNVAVTDLLPAGLTFVSATPSAGSYASGTGLWSVPALASGSSATLQVVALVANTGTLTNTAEVTASDQPDPDSTPGNNSPSEDDRASAGVGAAAPPSLSLTKSVTPGGTQLPGAEITYTVAFQNTGGTPASAFVLTDPNPATVLRINDHTDFKVGSVTNTLGSLTSVAVAYSNDNGATFTYTPASGAGGAPAGYDRNVTHIRWTFSGTLVQTAPNNGGSVSFTTRIR